MMDPCDKGSLEEASVSASALASSASALASSAGEENKRSCVNCGTTKTPLWRGGPAGPKSLCNACGIRTRKKGRPAGAATNEVAIANKKSCKGSKFGSSLKQRFLVLRRQVLMKGWRDDRKFGEVEQAAVLLMALSYGSLYT